MTDPSSPQLHGRAASHYMLTFVVMSFYGSQVCEFICTLNPWNWVAIVGCGVGAGFLLRTVLLNRLVCKRREAHRSRWQLGLDLLLFLLVGVGIMLYDSGRYGFPLGSGLKGVIGFATLGFFAAIDLALAREYEVAQLYDRQGLTMDPEAHYFSLPRKFAAFAITCSILVAAVLLLLLSRDLQVLEQSKSMLLVQHTQKNILFEVLIVLILLVLELANITLSYARNLRHFFGRQTDTLRAVTEGNLIDHVPVSTADEFGVIAKHTNTMIDHLRERTERLEHTQDATIVALAGLAETRDNETGMHIRRTQAYVRLLAEKLTTDPRFSDTLDDATIALLSKSAPLHDVGKVGVPDAILLKPGKLTDDEFTEMKRHTIYGAEALQIAENELGENSFLNLAREIAYTHHEKWDGSGYPQGLKEEAIPLSGRLMAVADVYDALISKRCYKPAFPHEKAKAIILEGRASHFDPDVVDAFIACESQFTDIAARLSDPEE